MNACEDKELLLQGLLDGELDAANTLSLEAHLRACPGCAQTLERLHSLRARLRTPGVRFTAPAQLPGRIQTAIAAARTEAAAASAVRPLDEHLPTADGSVSGNRVWPAPPRLPRKAAWWAWGSSVTALAASLVIALLIYLPPRALTDELVAAHIRSLLATHLTDVATSDRHTVKPWFAGKVDFSPAVIELADEGFPLVGGRLDYLHDRVVAALVYKRRQHIINVFVWPASGAALPRSAELQRDGYNVVGWHANGLQFWAVSDLNPSELQQLRAAFLRTRGE